MGHACGHHRCHGRKTEGDRMQTEEEKVICDGEEGCEPRNAALDAQGGKAAGSPAPRG